MHSINWSACVTTTFRQIALAVVDFPGPRQINVVPGGQDTYTASPFDGANVGAYKVIKTSGSRTAMCYI